VTRDAFVEALAWELTLRGVPHTFANVVEFVAYMGPPGEEHPDLGRWVNAYAALLASGAAQGARGEPGTAAVRRTKHAAPP
jgi:hypothetical protein